MKYKCKTCGSTEFISQLNCYDIYMFEEEKEKIIFRNREYIDDALELYCRDCSEKLEFDFDDIEM